MPLDPRAQAILDQIKAEGLPPFEEMSVPQAREVAAAFKEMQSEPPPIARTEDRTIAGPRGDIPIRIYTPEGDAPMPIMVYYHGGGWVIGSIDITDRPIRTLAQTTRSIVVSVEYRMAPEDKFPASIDDCFAATVWTAEHAQELGGDPERLVVIGDSAGGNLAAAVALQAREQGGPRVAYQVLIYPVTDFDFDRPSCIENADGYLLTRNSMRWFWGHYLNSDADGDDWRASPMRAADLSNLPPALVVTCEFDPLRDDGQAYAQRLRDAGVPVKEHRFDGMIHGFFWMTALLPHGQELMEEIATELQETLRPLAAA
jgi:acetyl esterase/lipase